MDSIRARKYTDYREVYLVRFRLIWAWKSFWQQQERAKLGGKYAPGTRRPDFDKLPPGDRLKAKSMSIEKYQKNLKDAKRDFPRDAFPVFLELDADESSDVYKTHWKRWIKLRRELKV